jgi:hypothetical protein
MVRASGVAAGLGLGLAVSWAAGCARMPEMPPASELAASAGPALAGAPLFARAGEQMRWRVRVGPFRGGSMQLSVAPPARIDGRAVAVLRGQFATSGIASMFENRSSDETTWLDLESGRPLRYRSHALDRGERSTVEASFAPRAVHLVERVPGRASRRSHQRVPEGGAPLNMYAAMLAMRTWPERATGPATLSVWARSRLWRATVRLAGVVVLKTELGHLRAHRIDGVAWRVRRDGSADPDAQPRRFRLYVSADRNRLPLLVETDSRFGLVRVELVVYRAPPAPAVSFGARG